MLGGVAFARARAAGRALTAIVFDIDLFKQVNDRYGHAGGDEALRSLGAWIRETVDGRGIVGRSGGDEFTILLDADATEAEAMLQRLRDRIEPLTVFGQTFGFNIRSGECQAGDGDYPRKPMTTAADQAVIRDKRQTHDREGR